MDSPRLVCAACGREQRPGALFCPHCGAQLPGDDTPAAAAEALKGGAAPLTVTLPGSGRRVELPAQPELLLGRLDAAHGIMPDLDLTDEDGLERGVSRAHCIIYRQRSGFYVEDLGSDNGTLLRGQRLSPRVPCALRDGDELQLGQLKLIVTLPA